MIPNIIPKQKIVFLGDQGVGKTSIINRFLYQKFDHSEKPTIGIDFITKTVPLQNRTIKLQLWDTAGQERFHSLIPSYIRDSNVAIIVYDICKPDTFDHISKWQEEIKNVKGKDVLIVLVGNKSDLEDQREISKRQGELKSEEMGGLFFEVSAKIGDGIANMFDNVITAIPLNNTMALTTHEITSNSHFANSNSNMMIQNDKALEPEIMGPTRREEEKRKVDKVNLSTSLKEGENLKLTTNEKKTDLRKKNCC